MLGTWLEPTNLVRTLSPQSRIGTTSSGFSGQCCISQTMMPMRSLSAPPRRLNPGYAKVTRVSAVVALYAFVRLGLTPPCGATAPTLAYEYATSSWNNNGIVAPFVQGMIMVKENICKTGFVVDKEDSSITRSHAYMMDLIQQSGLKVVHTQVQKDFPKELFTVRMYACAPPDA